MNNIVRSRSIRKNKRILGSLGENIVRLHLEKQGFELKTANYYKKFGEIDLVMEFRGKLHFIEVKSVSREIRMVEGKPVIHETSAGHRVEENIHPRKLKKIAKVIPVYLGETGQSAREWRFHAACVYIDRKQQKAVVKIIKDIPLPA